jgi:hypothetical protein
MLSVTVLLVVAAFICTVLEALGKCPGWIPTMLVVLILALQVLPR